MPDNKEKLNKLIPILEKASQLEKGKEIALANEFIQLDTKVENLNSKIDLVNENLKKKLDEELSYEVDEEKIVESVLAKVEIPVPKNGIDGKDYILTKKDKEEIANSIKVPIVEKVIEKTEVIKEQPIVTNEIKEVAVKDTGEEIVLKINELPLEEEFKIDASHIKNLPKHEQRYGGTKNLYQLLDVNIDQSTLANGDSLIYDSSSQTWKNGVGGSPQTEQYAIPTSGSTVTVANPFLAKKTVLTLIPAGTLATLTISFTNIPLTNGQTVTISTTQELTAITWSVGTFIGAPTTLGAEAFCSFSYSTGDSKWHRIG